MEALRRVGWGLLVAPEGQREEDAVNLALALSISEEEQRLQDEQDQFDALMCGVPTLEANPEPCTSTSTSTSTADPRPLCSSAEQRADAVAALPEKLRVSLKRAIEEAENEDRDVQIPCSDALEVDDNSPALDLDPRDVESLSSPRMLSLGAGFDEKMQRIASAFDLSSLRGAFSPRVNTDEDEQPCSTDDARSKSLRRLHRRLNKFTLVEYTISGDGNCQFGSLSDQLYRTPKMQSVVRRLVVQQLTDFPEYYSRFVPGDYKFYCWKMSQNHVWGDHLTLQAAADRYGIQISLITSYKDAPYMHIMPREIKSCRILWLSFFGELHYNSLYTEEDIALRRRMDENNAACVLF
jgi:hypothetical protein